MNVGALIVLAKLFQDAVGVSIIGPPAPPPQEIEPTGPGGIPSYCIRSDGKLTFPCWQKYIVEGGSNSEWQDYLFGR